MDNIETQNLLDMIKHLRDDMHYPWRDIADVINEEFGYSFSLSKYKSQYSRAKLKEEEQDDEEDQILAYIDQQKEKVKGRDILNQTNAYIRRLSREDTIKEIALECAKEMSSKKLLPVYFESDCESKGENKAILCISDWHYGIEFSNYWNTFNPEIAKQRIAKLCDKTIEYGLKNGVNQLFVVNLSDLIAGRIHAQIRYQSRVDVITQTIEISEILAEFLTNLSKYFKVEYRDCLDNHSRLEPNKGDSLDLESLVRITTWYLKERLKNTDIGVHENLFGEDIASFKVFEHKICAVHGHKDRPDNVIKNLTLMTQEHWDLILTAHRHHFSADESNECLVISNGSLMGTDTYAANLRLSSKPTQNLIIVSRDNVAESIYRIIVEEN